ncbi:polysaccharide deacetylase family protein [Corynebacterium propinquum]
MKKLAAIFGSFTIIASLFSSPLEAHADPVGSSDAAQSGATTHLASSAATVPGSSLPGSSLIPRWDQFQLSSQVLEFFHNSSDEAYRAFFASLPKEVQQLSSTPQPRSKPTPPNLQPGYTPPAPVAPNGNCSNCVALTFDDGPQPPTNRILDTLDAKHAKATFFVQTPMVHALPDTARRIVNSGHTIGNHGTTHVNFALSSPFRVNAEISQNTKAVQAVTGATPRWLRPPYGAHNDNVVQAARAHGMGVALWDVIVFDWHDRNANTVCERSVNQANGGDVVLLHDIHNTTADATTCIIDGLRAKGLEPVTLDRLHGAPEPGRVYGTR